MSTPSAPTAEAANARDERTVRPLWVLLLSRPQFVVCAVIVALIVIATVFAPVIAPFSPTAQDLANTLAGPSTAHPLGTDDLGRDVLSRLLYGGQVTLLGVVQAMVVFLLWARRWDSSPACRAAPSTPSSCASPRSC